MSNNSRITYNGCLNSIMDGLLLIEACRLGMLSPLCSPLSDAERVSCIKHGAVFVYDQFASGISRWTDGRQWSHSTLVDDAFLVSTEIATLRPIQVPRKGDGQAQQQEQQQRSCGIVGKPDGLIRKVFHVISSNGRHMHVVSYKAAAAATAVTAAALTVTAGSGVAEMARKPVPLASPSDDLFFANIRVDFSLYPHFLRIVGKQIEMRNKSVIVAMHPDSIQKWADKVQPSNPKSAEHASRSSLALVNSFHKQKRRKLAAAEKKIAPRVLAAKIQPRLAGSCTDILRSSEASMPAAAPAAENHSHFRSPTPSPPRKSERRQSTQVSRLQSTNELQLQLQSNHDQLRLHQRDESHPSQPSRHFPSTSQEATTTARYNVAEQEQASLLDFAAVMQHQQTNQRPQPCGMPPIEPSVRSTFDALCFKPGKDLSSYSLQYASSQPALQRYQHRSHGESSGAATRSPSVLQQGPLLAPLRRRLARNASPLSLQSQPPLLPHAVTLALHQTLSSAPLVSQQTQPDKIQRQQPQQTLPDPRPSSQPSRIQTQPRLSSPSGFHSQDQPPAMSRRTSLNVSHLSAEVSPQTASQHHSGRALATQMQSQSLQQYQSRRLPHALLSHPFQSQERAHQHEYSAWQQARFISGTTSDDIQRVAVLLHPRVHQLAHYQQLSQQQRQEQQQYVHVQLPTSYPHF